MRTSPRSVGLAATTGAVGALHLTEVLSGRVAPYLVPLSLAVVLLALATTVRMVRGCCFEARLAAVLLGTYSVVAAVLPVTVGLPGDGAATLTAGRLILLVLGAALVAQALLARGSGDFLPEDGVSPYAAGHVPPRRGRRG